MQQVAEVAENASLGLCSKSKSVGSWVTGYRYHEIVWLGIILCRQESKDDLAHYLICE